MNNSMPLSSSFTLVKHHVAEGRLLWALDKAAVLQMIAKPQHHLPKKEISCLLLCFTMPFHHVGFVHHVLFLFCALALIQDFQNIPGTGSDSENAKEPCVDELDTGEE